MCKIVNVGIHDMNFKFNFKHLLTTDFCHMLLVAADATIRPTVWHFKFY